MLAGIEEEGVAGRVVRVCRSIDLGAIGWTAAQLSGSGIAVGLQAKGTALIHRADLPPLGEPRALLDRAARDARALPRPRPQRRALREGARRSSRCSCPSRASRSGRATTPASCSWLRSSGASPRPVDPVELEASWPRLDLSACGRRPRCGAATASGRRVSEVTLEAVLGGRDRPGRRSREPRDAAPAGNVRRGGRQPAAGGQPAPRRRARRLRRRRAARVLREAAARALDRGRARRAGGSARRRAAPSAARRSFARPRTAYVRRGLVV